MKEALEEGIVAIQEIATGGKRLSKVTELLSAQVESLSPLKEANLRVKEQLDAVSMLQGKLEQSLGDLEQLTDMSKKESEELIANCVAEAGNMVTMLEENVKQQLGDFEQRLALVTKASDDVIQNGSTEMTGVVTKFDETLEQRLKNFDRRLTQSEKAAENSIENAVQQLSDQLTKILDRQLNDIRADLRDTREAIRDRFDTNTQQLKQEIANVESRLKAEMPRSIFGKRGS